MTKTPKRRTIEIYFILYLAALIFLIPDGSEVFRAGKGTGIKVFQPEFVLLPEKTTLSCRALIDSSGTKIISLDSVNTIFYSGDVEDVKFDFIVEDQTLKNSLTLNSESKPTTKFFRIEEHRDKQAAFFYWTPPTHDQFSKIYLVKVIATAKTKKPASNVNSKNSDQEGKIVKFTTQFSLFVIYINEPGGNPIFIQNFQRPSYFDTSAIASYQFQSQFAQPSTGNITMFTLQSEVKMIASQRWNNFIDVSNINLLKDLPPKYKILTVQCTPQDNGGKAEIYDITSSRISVRGITPSFGRMKVVVGVLRSYDKQEKLCDFTVVPIEMEQPEFDKYMYPDITYIIDPKLPLIGKEIKVIITDGKNIKAQSQRGEKIRFTPDDIDVDNVLYLERYIDGELFGTKYQIRILPYSEPYIVDVQQKGSNEVEVITRAFGVNNKSRNEVEKFIIEGNAQYRDLRGQISEKQEKSFPVVTQYFKFTPLDPNKPFHFKIIAIDRRGRKSLPKVWRE